MIKTHMHAYKIDTERQTGKDEMMRTNGAKTYDEIPIYGRIINFMDYVLHKYVFV